MAVRPVHLVDRKKYHFLYDSNVVRIVIQYRVLNNCVRNLKKNKKIPV